MLSDTHHYVHLGLDTEQMAPPIFIGTDCESGVLGSAFSSTIQTSEGHYLSLCDYIYNGIVNEIHARRVGLD